MLQEYLAAMVSTTTLNATFRMCCPLLLGVAGYSFVRKVGILNIALESFMLISAFFALLGSYLAHNEWVGMIFGFLAGAALSALYGLFTFTLGANGLVTGVGFNLSGWALTTMLLVAIFHTRGATNVGAVSFPEINIPLLEKIPVLGPIFNNHTALVYMAPILVIISHIIMYKTPFGLRARTIGLKPAAAETAGVNVRQYQWITMIVSGACMGLAGTFISINSLAMFVENMSGGRGFMVVAAGMTSDGNPMKGMLTAFVFAYCQALALTWSGLGIYSQLTSMLPYIAVICVLFFSNVKNIKEFGKEDIN